MFYLITFAVAIALLIALGFLYQAIGLRRDERRFPAPGRLIDAGGHKLHLYELGSGSPTVILESGISASSLNWREVQTQVAKFTRVCSYDRAGLGWSDLCEQACTPASLATQLHALVVNAGLPAPYILVGHSFGGLIVERSVAHAINAEIHGHADADRSMPADLVIAVNPAADSVLARQMIAALYSRKTEGTRPLFVSITSTGDWATGSVFPISTGLASVSKGFNQVEAPGPGNTQVSERKFYTSTPGHNEMLINHFTLDLKKTINSPQGHLALETNLEHNLSAEVFTLDGAGGKLDLWQIKRVGNVDVPYWDVQVHPSIIKDHGDIWNERAEAMMAAIFRMTNPMLNRNVKPRATLHRAPDFNRLQHR